MNKDHPRPAGSPRVPTPLRPPPPAVDPDSSEPELTAGPDQDTPEPGLDPTLPVNPARGAPGHQVPEYPTEDEDDEGRSVTEQVFEEGAEQAERDKVKAAGRHPPPQPG